MADLEQWLGSLDAAQLAALLERRPDVRHGIAPRNLAHLAERLEHPESIANVLRRVPLPLLQAAEAVQALGERANLAELSGLLQSDGAGHDAAVDAVVAQLREHGLAWPGLGLRIQVPAGLGEVFPDPLGLSAPLRRLLPALTAAELRGVLLALGEHKPPTKRGDLEDALARCLSDPDRVRAVVAQAPAEVAEHLQSMAIRDTTDEGFYSGSFDYEAHEQRRRATRWALDHGLLIGSRYGYDWRMPAEVGLALRGPNYRAPFNPRRPDPGASPIDPHTVRSAASAAATELAQQANAVLDTLARTPVPLAKSGGLPVRELGRLAKAAAADEVTVRLVLELGAAGGLLDDTGPALQVSDTFERWRAADPGPRYAGLLSAWWQFPLTPTQSVDGDGKAIRALARHASHAGGRAARGALLGALAAIAEGTATDRSSIAEAALWDRPIVELLAQDAAEPLATVWREADLLGVIAQGALTDLGRALLAGERAALESGCVATLPGSAEVAIFGSDLTVLVAGSPSARVSTLLDAAADRESRGAAITWRFSPASIRRALDDGTDASTLTSELSSIASAGLPQPLRYLINDVARRHGVLRLATAETMIRSADTALLAEVAADRKLAKLGLRVLAPSVLGSQAPPDATLQALRKAGYFPMPEDDERPAPDRPAVRPHPAHGLPRLDPVPAAQPQPVSAHALAAALLDPGTGPPPQLSGTEAKLAALNRRLSADEISQLAHAVDTGESVLVRYQASSGTRSRRTISDAWLSGGSLFAWCHLRDDERVFTVAQLLSVAAAAAPES